MAASPDVIVIGAGIAGSSVAREARDRGFSVLVFDPSPETAASRAALAISKDSWHKGEQRERVARSVRWYLTHRWASFPQTAVSSPKEGAKAAEGYCLIDPVSPLVEPDVAAAAFVNAQGLVESNGKTFLSRLVVVAAGPRTWGLLDLPAGKVTWGHTLVSTEATAAAPLIIYNYAPYRSLVVARVNGAVRVGSSLSKSYERSEAQIKELLRMAESQGFLPESRGWNYVAGVRSTHPEETGKPVWKTDHLVAMAGFGRCGYSLAPARAMEILNRAFGSPA